MTFDDWMDHKGSAGGGDFLKKWKEDGEVDVVLHPRALPAVVWSHSWYSVFVDKETKKEKLRFTRFNSMESEKVLKNQRFRRPDGSREKPPEICPFSLTLEWVRAQIEEGKISWIDPIFDIAAGEDGEIIHAGGFCNLFGRDDLTDDELAELRKAGIRRDEAYTENGAARMQYVIPVIPYDEPSLGCVVAIETQTLGDKLKKCIRDRREDLGDEKGDPRTAPVVFRWVFDEKKTFANKYDVKVMSSLPVRVDQLKDDAPETLVEKMHQLEAALDSTPPSTNKITDPSNLVQLRKSFEKYWVHKVAPPWDELFARAMAAAKGTPAAQDPADFDTDEIEGKGDDEADPTSPSTGAPAQDGDAEEVECDKCGKGMPETADTCPHCGAKYVMDTAKGYMVLAPEAPPPKPRSRSAAAAARPAKRAEERGSKS